ncbi:hypothetical protein ACPCSD_33045 [Streptomyces griseoincarnatus]
MLAPGAADRRQVSCAGKDAQYAATDGPVGHFCAGAIITRAARDAANVEARSA